MAVRQLAGGVLATLALATAGASLAADDPYLWLEDRNGDKALAWVAEQNARTTKELQSDPRYEAYVDTAVELFTASDGIAYGYVQGNHVYNFWQDGSHNLGIWRRTTPASYQTAQPEWETVIDFDALAAAEGKDWVFSNVDCLAPEYKSCLVHMSPDGGDALEIREFDLTTKTFVKDGFFSPVSKSELYWYDADTLILAPAYETEQQTSSGYSRLIKLWKRGTPLADAETVYEAGLDDGWTFAYLAEDGEFRDFLVGRAPDFYTSETFVRKADGELERVPIPADAIIQMHFHGQLVFSLRSPWRTLDGQEFAAGGLYSFDFQNWVKTGELSAIETLVEPNPRTAIEGADRTKDTLFVSMIDNVRGRALAFTRAGGRWQSRTVPLPDNGDISIVHADSYGKSVSFSFTDFLTPPSLLWSEDDGVTLKAIKSEVSRFDASFYVSEQHEATSRDGTKVPYFVVRSKDQKGPLPTLLYGYGGFEESMTPNYSGTRGRLWLGQGNLWALANIRGGGEFGPAWHQAALKENRQRAYDDFAAIAEDLVKRGLTTPKQLGIVGGSNGGLLTGVLLTQRPDLFGAVISEVPLLDMLRYTLLPAGASWIAEYGDPDIPEEAAYLASYSPYQNVKPGVAYPRAMFMTSTADDRVHPGHARKMAARMIDQGHNVLFYEETEGGHGGGGDLRRQAAYLATQYLFLQRTLEGGEPKPLASAPADRDVKLGEPAATNCAPSDAMDRAAPVAAATPLERVRETQSCAEAPTALGQR